MERFLFSFECFSFQNRKEVSENYAKYHKNEDLLKLFGLSLFLLYFGKSLFYKRSDYFIAKIIMGLHKNEDIKSKEIIQTIIKDDKNNFTNNEQILSQKSIENETKENLETINKEIKKEMLKISEEKMNARIKELNINDEENSQKNWLIIIINQMNILF